MSEVFYDAENAEEIWSGKKGMTFDDILIKQINKCVEILSKEELEGYKSEKNGLQVEDVKEVIINSVETLRMLMSTNPVYQKSQQVKEILKQVDDEYKRVVSQDVKIGERIIKVQDLTVEQTRYLFKKYKSFKAEKYRELFEVLINIYKAYGDAKEMAQME